MVVSNTFEISGQDDAADAVINTTVPVSSFAPPGNRSRGKSTISPFVNFAWLMYDFPRRRNRFGWAVCHIWLSCRSSSQAPKSALKWKICQNFGSDHLISVCCLRLR